MKFLEEKDFSAEAIEALKKAGYTKESHLQSLTIDNIDTMKELNGRERNVLKALLNKGGERSYLFLYMYLGEFGAKLAQWKSMQHTSNIASIQ